MRRRPTTLHRDSWDQYAAICESEIARLTLALEVAKADCAAAVAENDRLRSALLWIDNHDPEIVAAAEDKFGFKLLAI